MTNDDLVTLTKPHMPAQKRVKSGKIFASLKNTGRVGGRWVGRQKRREASHLKGCKQSPRTANSAHNGAPANLSPVR